MIKMMMKMKDAHPPLPTHSCAPDMHVVEDLQRRCAINIPMKEHPPVHEHSTTTPQVPTCTSTQVPPIGDTTEGKRK